MDIIEANEGLWYGYGLLLKDIFDDKDIGETEGEPRPLKLSPKEEAKARLAATVAAEAVAQVDDEDEEALAEELVEEAALEGDDEAGDEEDLSAADIM